MKKYIKLINKIFQLEIISDRPKEGFEELYYSVNSNSFFSLVDKKKMQSLFQISLGNRFFFKKKRQAYTH